MTNGQEINEDEIRIIGGGGKKNRSIRLWWLWLLLALAMVAVGVLVVVLQPKNQTEPLAETPVTEQQTVDAEPAITWLDNVDNSQSAEIVVLDTVVDSMQLQVLIPINTTPELYIGKLSDSDSDILLATMAADIRRDNGKIVGAYVYAGEPLSWGLSKRGYCAIFDGRMTIGVADNSPLFEQATEQGGFFFRQYAAVDNGAAVENNPENAAPRRALCVMDGRYCIVACADRVMMNDFSKALAKLGVEEAVYLVGGSAHGWWRDGEGRVNHFIEGNDRPYNKKYMNYIVFRAN